MGIYGRCILTSKTVQFHVLGGALLFQGLIRQRLYRLPKPCLLRTSGMMGTLRRRLSVINRICKQLLRHRSSGPGDVG